jgi:hypothetical protein
MQEGVISVDRKFVMPRNFMKGFISVDQKFQNVPAKCRKGELNALRSFMEGFIPVSRKYPVVTVRERISPQLHRGKARL